MARWWRPPPETGATITLGAEEVGRIGDYAESLRAAVPYGMAVVRGQFRGTLAALALKPTKDSDMPTLTITFVVDGEQAAALNANLGGMIGKRVDCVVAGESLNAQLALWGAEPE